MRFFHSQNRPNETYAWTQVSATGQGPARDGAYGFYISPYHYIAAGWEGGTATRKYVYRSTNTTSWSATTDAPFTGRHTMATCEISGTAYVIGGDVFNFGNDGSYANGSYSFNGSSWTTITSDCGLGDRSLTGCATLNGDIYLIGGQKSRFISDGSYNSVLKSTNNALSFSSIATHPFPGGNLWGSLCAFNGKLWKVCGGVYDDASLSNRTYPVDIYSSTDGVTWTFRGYFPGIGRQYHQTIVFDNKIWVIGGVNTTTPNPYNLNDVWYSSNGVDWTELLETPWTKRHAMTAWVVNDVLYIMGGTTNPSGALTNEIWKLEAL